MNGFAYLPHPLFRWQRGLIYRALPRAPIRAPSPSSARAARVSRSRIQLESARPS
jgi:hypothetical protein